MMRTLTDEELVRHLDDQRKRSPVIEELCSRLENIAKLPDTLTCPVCAASVGVADDMNGVTLT